MVFRVNAEDLNSVASYWRDKRNNLSWQIPFILPPWLEAWWNSFGPKEKPDIYCVYKDDRLIGIAPLFILNNSALLIGSIDVCDYLDFAIAPGEEKDFFTSLLGKLKDDGVTRLRLDSVKPDSKAMTNLTGVSGEAGSPHTCQSTDVTIELDLPPSWDAYLDMLTAKQRHELERKLRRLERAGSINFHIIKDTDDVPSFMATFLELFVMNPEKAAFMTERMKAYFQRLAMNMAEAGLFRGAVLELHGTTVASLLGFDYNGIVYLYNSSFDPQFSSLSVGVLSKVLFIKDSIENEKKRFDFLKGGEQYKYHLGGKAIPLFQCQVDIN